MFPILNEFFATCEQNSLTVTPSSIAVLYRGKAMEEYLGNAINQLEHGVVPWVRHNYHVKDILLGKLLYELGELKKGYHFLEKGYYDALYKIHDLNYHCSSTLIQAYIEKDGFIRQRTEVFEFLKLLPSCKGHMIGAWINAANQKIAAAGMNFRLNFDNRHRNLIIDNIFAKEIQMPNRLPFYSGTIHSVKGRTFDAVLLMLDKRAGTHSNYVNILRNGPKENEEEELRAVYVGLTRPTKILMLAVPSSDVPQWKVKLIMP